MATKTIDTGERLLPSRIATLEQRLMVLRHFAGYRIAVGLLEGARNIVEIGSGEGYGSRFLTDRGFAVTGLDVDIETLFRCARTYASAGCRFVCFGGGEIPMRSGRFDGALALQVIEHVDEDELLASEISRLLVPGGTCVLTTPNAALRLRSGEKPWNIYHRREYEAAQLEALVRPFFRRVDVKGIEASPAVERLELRRLYRIRTLHRLGSRRLRLLLPTVLETLLRSVVRRLASPGGGREKFSVADYTLGDDRERALDLIAICRK
ncbi:MAG TPA: class I SAM-dependent methyltransferase [Thermoanaerobaculia bacterium]|nr:class I SAM-dependent methyltransferase [Thermoanaerobaculia bacterium]